MLLSVLKNVLIVLAVVIGSLIVVCVSLRPSGGGRLIALGVTLLVAFACARDVVAYNSLSRRAACIKAEIPRGFAAQGIARYLQDNEKRLQIREWRRWEKGKKMWYTISFHKAFSVVALLRGHGGLVIRLDPENETVQQVAWFL